MNLKEDKCYVLDEKNASPSLLKEMESQNPSGSQFMVYNTHEDVLDLLAAGKPSAYKAGKTTGIFGDEDKRWYNLGNGIHFGAKVVYQAAAFYFSLQAKGICLSEGGFLGTYTRFPVTVNLDYYFRLDPKGSGERTGQGVRSEGETGETSYRPYEGSRGLEKYQYDVTFSINYPNLQFTSEDMGIYRGY